MDDHLASARARREADNQQRELELAAKEARKIFEGNYDAAWNAVIRECTQVNRDTACALNIAPFRRLADVLTAWGRDEWLVAIQHRVAREVADGLDNHEGNLLGQLLFLDALCLLIDDGDDGKATEFLYECRPFPFGGLANVADCVREGLLHYPDRQAHIARERAKCLQELPTAVDNSPAWKEGDPVWRFDNGVYHFRGFKGDDLTAKPLAVLRALVDTRQQYLSKRDLLNEVWGDAEVEEDVTKVAVGKVRDSLRKVAARAGIEIDDPIPNSRDFGWQLALPK